MGIQAVPCSLETRLQVQAGAVFSSARWESFPALFATGNFKFYVFPGRLSSPAERRPAARLQFKPPNDDANALPSPAESHTEVPALLEPDFMGRSVQIAKGDRISRRWS